MKKFLSLVLAVVLLVGVIPMSSISVSADETYGDFTYTVTDGEVTITDYTGAGVYVTIPSVINGYIVTSIGKFAFNGCSSLMSVNIGNSITSIGNFAFYDCSSLTSVNIGNSVTSIGNFAFGDCIWLETITVENGNAVYHSSGNCLIKTGSKILIQGCKNSIIPNDGSVTSIGNSAFNGCSSLTSINIPNSVTSIGDSAFRDCYWLKSITIPNSVTSMSNSAFYSCSSLTSVNIGNSVTSIGSYAFGECYSLKSITIPDSVTSIGSSAFYGCGSLTSINIPDSVTSIGNSAFDACWSLKDVYYSGTEDEWNAISIGSWNDLLTNATISFACICGGAFGGWITEIAPTCVEKGRECRVCADCGNKEYEYTDALGHNFENCICTVCGEELKFIESDHNYANYTNKYWIITKDGAKQMVLNFSADTKTESGYDYIYIYDGDGNQIGKYSGTELASKTITVDGDTVKIRLTSDGAYNYYGFYAEVYAVYPNDLNGDGAVNAGDLTVLRQKLLSGKTENGADINGDGATNIIDLVAFKKMMGQ